MKEGWEEKKLGEVCTFENGDRGKNYPSRSKFVKAGIPFVNTGHLENKKIQFKEMNFISKETYDLISRGKFIEGDLLFCLRGSLGKFALVETGMTGAIASSLVIVRPSRDISSDYLSYFFGSSMCEKMIGQFAGGAAQPNLGAKDLMKFQIPIPPISEQKEIVALLDEAFAAIDTAKANIEKNIENANELFQSRLNEIISRKGEGWEEKRLGDLSYIKSGGTPLRSKKEYWNDGNIPWYSSGELNDLYTSKPNRFITKEGLENSNAKLFSKGSLLIGMYDTAALKMSIADRDASFNQAIAGVEPIDDLNLIFVLNSINAIKPKILKERRGVRQKNLSLKKIKDINIDIPPIEVQNNIVCDLEIFQEHIDNIIHGYHHKLSNIKELKQSLLQKAFAGELT